MQNHLLAELPQPQRQRWWPQLEYFDMPLGRVMYEAGAILTHVYFPTTAIVSLLYVMESGASVNRRGAPKANEWESLLAVDLRQRLALAGDERGSRWGPAHRDMRVRTVSIDDLFYAADQVLRISLEPRRRIQGMVALSCADQVKVTQVYI